VQRSVDDRTPARGQRHGPLIHRARRDLSRRSRGAPPNAVTPSPPGIAIKRSRSSGTHHGPATKLLHVVDGAEAEPFAPALQNSGGVGRRKLPPSPSGSVCLFSCAVVGRDGVPSLGARVALGAPQRARGRPGSAAPARWRRRWRCAAHVFVCVRALRALEWRTGPVHLVSSLRRAGGSVCDAANAACARQEPSGRRRTLTSTAATSRRCHAPAPGRSRRSSARPAPARAVPRSDAALRLCVAPTHAPTLGAVRMAGCVDERV
jgi:hypothetical protein